MAVVCLELEALQRSQASDVLFYQTSSLTIANTPSGLNIPAITEHLCFSVHEGNLPSMLYTCLRGREQQSEAVTTEKCDGNITLALCRETVFLSREGDAYACSGLPAMMSA